MIQIPHRVEYSVVILFTLLPGVRLCINCWLLQSLARVETSTHLVSESKYLESGLVICPCSKVIVVGPLLGPMPSLLLGF